nr:oligosaccharide flippase family protein [Candidatus Baldrarchaeota archaeon]
MQAALEIAKKSATGSVQLFIGQASSTAIMALGTMILARLITPAEYGLYSIALIPSYMTILFRDWGINSALTKFTASLRAQKSEEKTYEIIKAGLIFETAMGFILSLILVFISGFIASTVFNRPESAPLIAIASVTIFAGALQTAAQSTFVGFERMELNSLTNICQAIVKSVAAPILVIAGFGALGATLGYTISFIASAIIALTVLYLTLIRKIKRKNPEKSNTAKTLKEMLHYGVPLSIASIIGGFLIQFYAFIMAIYCTDVAIGNYQVATQFAAILTFFTIPISTVLFPAFSKIDPQDENGLLQTVFASSIKYASLILVPTTIALMILSEPLVSTLFGEKWTQAPLFLTLYVINNLFVIFGSLTLTSLLAGIGETKMQMKLSLVTLAIGIPLSLILIPSMGIIGLILTIIIAGKPSLAMGIYWVRRKYNVRLDIESSMRILTASAIAATASFLAINFTAYANWIELTIGTLTFAATYLLATPTTGAINKSDINNLKTMFSGLGALSKLINIPLNFMEKLPNLK